MFSEQSQEELRRLTSFSRLLLHRIGPLCIYAFAFTMLAGVMVTTFDAFQPPAHQFMSIHATCLTNGEFGILTRSCAGRLIAHSNRFPGIEITGVTGIADISPTTKRVEYEWMDKDSEGLEEPRTGRGTAVFRKYDDGWRLSN